MTWLAASLGAFWLCAAIDVIGAWLLRRRTTLSARNLYLLGGAASLLCGLAILARRWDSLLVLAPLAAGPTAGALFGRRWRLADLGAGEELREHELSRRWFWQPGPQRPHGERVYIRSQGEIVHTRPWPEHEPYVPMTGEPHGPRLPRSEGEHIFSCGVTGTGKTTTALRVVAARALHDHSAVLAIDQKGDEQAEQMLRDIAAAAGRTFVLIDPRSPDTDRWQPDLGRRRRNRRSHVRGRRAHRGHAASLA